MAERWLFVNGAASYGGHEVMMMRFVAELSCQRLVTPRVLARGGSLLREKSAAFATSLCLPAQPARQSIAGRMAQLLRELRVFFAVLAVERPALCVVAEGCLLSQPFLALLCRLARVPFAIYVPLVDSATSLGFRSGALRDWIVRRVYANLPRAWMVLTREQAESFAAWSGTSRPVLVLPNAVSAQIEALCAEPVATTENHTPLRVLVLGRFDAHHKGLDLLLDYLDRNRQAAQAVRVSLVGEGPFRYEIEHRTARSPRLQQCLQVTGWTDAVTAYRAHDVLLLASRFEGVPLVMLEAMAVGLPVVASDLPGTRAYLPPECLFAVGDIAHAFAILDKLRDSRERRTVAERNRTVFARRVSGAAFADSVRRLTSELPRLTAHRGREGRNRLKTAVPGQEN